MPKEIQIEKQETGKFEFSMFYPNSFSFSNDNIWATNGPMFYFFLFSILFLICLFKYKKYGSEKYVKCILQLLNVKQNMKAKSIKKLQNAKNRQNMKEYKIKEGKLK